MATELQIREQLATMLSLPQPLARLERSLGTVQWPGQMVRLNFPSGMELSAAERQDVTTRLDELTKVTTGENLERTECSKARLSLLTKLLLGYPTAGNSSEKAADARVEFYQEAVSDIAPWALVAAIKRWVRGEVETANVDFAPSPGTLRRLCEVELGPFKAQAVKLKRLLSAVSIERAMDPEPLPQPEVKSAGANVVSIGVRKM